MENETSEIRLWRKQGVPHKGWDLVDVEDLGSDNYQSCQMCGKEDVRFIHVLSHTNFNELVYAGCICAGKMTEDYEQCKEREKQVRNISSRRKHWLTRNWKVSKKGNDYLKINNTIVGIFFKDNFYFCFIDNKIIDTKRECDEEAKMFLFDQLVKRGIIV